MAPKKSTEQTTTQTSTVPASSPVSTPVVSEKPKKVKKTETPAVQSAPVVSETPVSQSEKPKKTSKKPQSTETPAVQPESVVESSTQSVSEKSKKASKKKSQTTEAPVEQTEQQSEQPVEKKKRASKKNVVVSEGESAESESAETQSTETSESAEKRVRKVVNQDTLRADVEQLKTHVDEEIQRLRTSEQKNKGVKFLKVVNKSLKTLLADLNRVLKTKTKATRSKNTSSGFMKPVKISSEMSLFTKWDPSQLYSRVDVTKFLCNYIKVNQLQNPEDRRQILCDDSLSSLLKLDKSSQNPLTYPGLQQHIQQHFITDVTSVSEEEAHP